MASISFAGAAVRVPAVAANIVAKVNGDPADCPGTFEQVDFSSSPGILIVREYNGAGLPALADLRRQLPSENGILIVPREKLPKPDLMFMLERAGLFEPFEQFCDKLAFCTAIKGLDGNGKWWNVDAFSIPFDGPAMLAPHGLSESNRTIFLNAGTNRRPKMAYQMITDLGHELCHHDIWQKRGVRQDPNNDIPLKLADLICVSWEREAAINLYAYYYGNGIKPGRPELAPLTHTPGRSELVKHVQMLHDRFLGLYQGLERSGFEGALGYDVSPAGLGIFDHFPMRLQASPK